MGLSVPSQQNAQHVQDMVTAALTATAGETDTVKAAAVSGAATAAGGAIPAPSTGTANILWGIVVSVLGLVTLGSAISIIVYALENKASPPDSLITIFTTALSGLIGLYVKPPSGAGQ
jgi:hypothetical protein